MELGGYSSEGGLSLLLKYLLRPVTRAAAFRRVLGTPAATARVQKWCTPVALAAALRSPRSQTAGRGRSSTASRYSRRSLRRASACSAATNVSPSIEWFRIGLRERPSRNTKVVLCLR